MNEGHTLLPQQKELLDSRAHHYEILSVPAKGWTVEEMDVVQARLAERFIHLGGSVDAVVFVSPIAYLLKSLLTYIHFMVPLEEQPSVFVMHNDRREAKEVPDGRGGKKVIHVVAATGWTLE